MSDDIQVRGNGNYQNGISRSGSPVDSLFRDLERQFDRILGRGWPYPSRSSSLNRKHGNVDVINRDDSYEVRMDMPGVDNEDVDVSIRNNNLEIRAEREDTFENEEDDYVRYANKKQSHRFSFGLGQDEVEIDEIEASLDNGVLSINLPKKNAEEVHKKIDVD